MEILNSLFPKAGRIHFCGIAGIGMSALAILLKELGYSVQGSDLAKNYVAEMVESKGIEVFDSQDAAHMSGVSLVVRSTAIKDTNPEIIEAKKHNISIITRTELLAEFLKNKTSVSISGTHGKTTTTSMMASMLENAGLSPTVINGGILMAKGVNAYLGSGPFVVAEADESDGTFIKIPSTIAVVTNIDPEHLDYYGSFENAKEAFYKFVTNIPFYGFSVLCVDHKEVRALSQMIKTRPFITYGITSTDADVRAVNIRQTATGSCFDVETANGTLKDIELNVHGIHNVSNSLGAIAVAIKLGIDPRLIVKGFAGFDGVKRRFITTGEYMGVKFIDDYAHHPEEIKATLSTAKSITKVKHKVIAIFQPHKFSRLKALFDDFAHAFKDADVVYVTDVYPAGEAPIEHINAQTLVEAMRKVHSNVVYLGNIDELPQIVRQSAVSGDLFVFLGAGTTSKWAYDLPKKMSV